MNQKENKNFFPLSCQERGRGEVAAAYPLQSYYSRIYKTYDLVNRLFTFGLDKKWRRHAVEVCLESHPHRVLDLCCGTGDLAINISQAANNTVQITGFDLNREMLAIARQKASLLKTAAVDFIQGDAGSMPFKNNEFDCITIGFGFRNLTFENPNREQYLREINRIMKPGARLLILESAQPENRFVGFFYRLYLTLILVPLGGLLSGDWHAYRYLADSSACFYSYTALCKMLEDIHLSLQIHKKYLFGSVNLLIATKKGT
jgi:demethylmenaquinone methyltransferase/2-methoxy-6-polyprenyl-1,4-benzoquinol methylase